ncbi:alpha/beta hydrolase [Corynebacterium halotolerans]|uniref:Phospholipase/Carboxylesterase n=1 Tax=Corynebacterium halotolerans YIM 70093 = DSM 44683 TaxID=1121362 RepID=M1NNS0_9CORY|nr:dienelactone hydrolase family protein [Corynebacterium halotolerans]AGF71142.1 phospholipase/Carboxylesterase [Corynebacterium halotolerans YIM 70093 = DSM 44683]
MTGHFVQETPKATDNTVSEPETYGAAAADAALVIYGVHGRGQSPAFIRELADRVGQLDQLRWVMPAAPENSWYPAGFMASFEENEPFLGDALKTVERHLGELLGSPAPVVALGFSQGACLLAEYLLTARPAVDGIVLHTGGYLGPDHRTFHSEPGFAGTPAAVLTAREDAWVPLHRSEETAEELTAAGAKVTLTVYEDTEHHINDDAVDRIRELLKQVTTPVPKNADK